MSTLSALSLAAGPLVAPTTARLVSWHYAAMTTLALNVTLLTTWNAITSGL